MSAAATSKPFDLLRWFSVASLAALLVVGGATGSILAHFIADQVQQRDGALTAQFIENTIAAERQQLGAAAADLVRFIDPRADVAASGVPPQPLEAARASILAHLARLPDALLTNLYASDGRIVWSTNERLIGTVVEDNRELAKAFASPARVARHHASNIAERKEQQFVVPPREFFTENYVPLVDGKGQVALVAEVYTEAKGLLAALRRGNVLVWSTTIVGGLVIYLALFSIILRASKLLREQERQLVEAESRAFMGDMATALAHSLRNPLASVRSSAELAVMTDDPRVRRNAQDIITQVDFLSKWIRELLLYSRPIAGEAEAVDLCAVLASVLDSFAPTLARSGVRVVWVRDPGQRPLVEGNTSLVTQALHCVISNALEAMPGGGELRIELQAAGGSGGVDLEVTDTGVGMSSQQLAKAFMPFHTNKPHGLGVGLPLLKRAMERFGGFVTLSSSEQIGTQVRLHFRT